MIEGEEPYTKPEMYPIAQSRRDRTEQGMVNDIYAQHFEPCLAPPSSAVGATRMVSPPEGLMTSPDDSSDFEDTMR